MSERNEAPYVNKNLHKQKSPGVVEFTDEDDVYCVLNPSYDPGERRTFDHPGCAASVEFDACWLKGDPAETEIFDKIPARGDRLFPLYAALEAFLFECFLE